MVEEEPVPDEVAQEIRMRTSSSRATATTRRWPSAPRRPRRTPRRPPSPGMNETFLNVRGADEVVDAVRRCWSSLFGARTVFYRAKQGFGQADMDIAVVVQLQILSTRAGVMFTIDPASGERDRLVIEGSLGLGESVVSGRSLPTATWSTRRPSTSTKRDVKRKELVIEPLPDGGTRTRELSGEEATQPVLSDDEVRAVAKLGDPRRGALRRPRRTPSGPSTRRARLDAPVAAGDRIGRRQERRARRARGRGPGPRPRRRSRRRARRGEDHLRRSPRATTSRRATSSSPT